MTSLWNAQGNSPANIIMWMAIITVMLIVASWFAKELYPTHVDMQKADYDLQEIKSHINRACGSVYYNAQVNPRMEQGTFNITNESICVFNTRVYKCTFLLCNTEINQSFDLKNLDYINIEKNESHFNFTQQ